MRPIELDMKEKAKIFKELSVKFAEMLDGFTYSKSGKFEFSFDISKKLKNKIQLIYTPGAWLRMRRLVDSFSTEIGWFGLVQRLEKDKFLIYDVLVCKQQVSGAKVDTEDDDMIEFISGLTDEQSRDMHFQAHSHVNFSVDASGTDMENQADILNTIPGHEGFYIFQIWNKRGEINTYLYDLDDNMFYDRNDVEIKIQDPYGTLDDFIKEAEKKVTTPKPNYYVSNGAYPVGTHLYGYEWDDEPGGTGGYYYYKGDKHESVKKL